MNSKERKNENKKKNIGKHLKSWKKDHKLTGTYSIQKRRKIQSRDQYIRTCYWRSFISGTKKKWKPIVSLLRTIQVAERNYEIYKKELLVIVEALTKWRQYLLDATEKFKVWIDHENLKYFKKPHKLNRWQARWYLKL